MNECAMRNLLLGVLFSIFLFLGSPYNSYDESISVELKAGCTDESAINYCFDCSKQEGTCLIDNEFSSRCEDPIVKWKKKWYPESEFSSRYAVFTYEDCWDSWEVTIYDSLGVILWQSNTPNEAWSGMSQGKYYEGGEYYLSIIGDTRGMTKSIDVLTEFDLIFNN